MKSFYLQFYFFVQINLIQLIYLLNVSTIIYVGFFI